MIEESKYSELPIELTQLTLTHLTLKQQFEIEVLNRERPDLYAEESQDPHLIDIPTEEYLPSKSIDISKWENPELITPRFIIKQCNRDIDLYKHEIKRRKNEFKREADKLNIEIVAKQRQLELEKIKIK